MTQAQALIDNGFNIDNLDSLHPDSATTRVAVLYTDEGEEKSGFIIAGKNSSMYQDAARAIRVDGLVKSSKRKTALDSSTQEGAEAFAKLIDGNEVTLACSVVVGWFGFASNGQVAVFNKPTAEKMLCKYPTWREKISQALSIEENFTKG